MKFINRNGTQSSLYNVKEAFTDPNYVTWLKDETHMQLCDVLVDHYKLFCEGKSPILKGIKFEIKGLSTGLMLDSILAGKDLIEVLYIQLCMAERFQEHGYIVNFSEIRGNETNECSHIIYLKPSIRLPKVDEKSNQLFGNIHLEVRSKSDQVVFCKLLVHPYSDSNFCKNRPFSELISTLTAVH